MIDEFSSAEIGGEGWAFGAVCGFILTPKNDRYR